MSTLYTTFRLEDLPLKEVWLKDRFYVMFRSCLRKCCMGVWEICLWKGMAKTQILCNVQVLCFRKCCTYIFLLSKWKFHTNNLICKHSLRFHIFTWILYLSDLCRIKSRRVPNISDEWRRVDTYNWLQMQYNIINLLMNLLLHYGNVVYCGNSNYKILCIILL